MRLSEPFAPIRRGIDRIDAALGRWADSGSVWREWAFEFLRFGVKQGWACLFGGLLLALILATYWLYPGDAPLARYDFLFVAAVLIQIALLVSRLESLAEARVILIFHIAGTAMEIFKTGAGSWTYPEDNLIRIAGVPLFSGFMYAAVGSYLARVWRLFRFEFPNYPPFWMTMVLALGAYVNFFSHHFIWDLRWALFVFAALIWARTWVVFTPWRKQRRMPLLIGFGLVALFIWIAENLATFGLIWRYPTQDQGWTLVPLAKFGSWYLLMLLSFVLVDAARRLGGRKTHGADLD